MMCDYTFFSKDPSQWIEAFQSLWEHHNICPILEQFHIVQVTQPELSSLTHILVWGDPKRFHSNVAFLLILAEECMAGERVYGFTMVWVPPYQARVSTIDDAVRKLTLLASAGPNWPYAFVWFNGDACHLPLLKEGHFSTMVEGMPSNIPCGRIWQLEVHQLLHSEAWVVYPKGLNGCLVSVITTLPESLSHSTTMLDDEPTFLQVDISQFTTDGHESKTPFLGSGSTSTSPTHPPMVPPPKAESSQHDHAGQWTPIMGSSGHLWSSIGVFHAQKTSVPGLRSTTLSQARRFCQTSGHLLSGVPTSKHSSWCQPDNLTIEEISLPVETLGLGTGSLPGDLVQLQEEVGGALGHLLVTRSSLDACQRKQVLDFEMTLCQNESETTEAIKEAKTLCTYTTREAEAHQAMLISEAEAWHATCIKEAEANCASVIVEAENCCSTAMRKVESHSTKQACSIQQSHTEGMQHLEMETIGEEGKDCLSFLITCGAALWASHPKDSGVLVTPFHLLLGNMALSTLLNISPWYLLLPTTSSSYCPHSTWAPGPIQMVTPLPPARQYPHLNWKLPQEWPLRSHSTQREGMKHLFTKL